jgi:hypothetical protein
LGGVSFYLLINNWHSLCTFVVSLPKLFDLAQQSQENTSPSGFIFFKRRLTFFCLRIVVERRDERCAFILGPTSGNKSDKLMDLTRL